MKGSTSPWPDVQHHSFLKEVAMEVVYALTMILQ